MIILLEGNILTNFDDLIEPSESVIWKGKPTFTSFMLSSFGGVFFALIFLGISSIWLLMGVPILQSPMLIAIPVAIILIVAGLILFTKEFGIFHYFHYWHIPWASIWAISLIVIGILLVFTSNRKPKSTSLSPSVSAFHRMRLRA